MKKMLKMIMMMATLTMAIFVVTGCAEAKQPATSNFDQTRYRIIDVPSLSVEEAEKQLQAKMENSGVWDLEEAQVLKAGGSVELVIDRVERVSRTHWKSYKGSDYYYEESENSTKVGSILGEKELTFEINEVGTVEIRYMKHNLGHIEDTAFCPNNVDPNANQNWSLPYFSTAHSAYLINYESGTLEEIVTDMSENIKFLEYYNGEFWYVNQKNQLISTNGEVKYDNVVWVDWCHDYVANIYI